MLIDRTRRVCSQEVLTVCDYLRTLYCRVLVVVENESRSWCLRYGEAVGTNVASRTNQWGPIVLNDIPARQLSSVYALTQSMTKSAGSSCGYDHPCHSWLPIMRYMGWCGRLLPVAAWVTL